MNDIESTAIAAAVTERISELLRYRVWYRIHRGAIWTDMRKEHEAELRGLVRLVRGARKAARAVEARADALSASKAYRDHGYHDAQAAPMSEDELIGAYDADSGFREGQPEFNGAFR